MSAAIPHISICICTYRRGDLLKRLLNDISHQETSRLFTYSIVVADNDPEQTAKAFVAECAAQMSCLVLYCAEAERNIALVRNRAVANAQGDFIAFIDDDELPAKDWLLVIFNTCSQPGVSGVLGPVVARYNPEPPTWVRAGGFYERPRHCTGFKLGWTQCRTGNVLLRRAALEKVDGPFQAEFGRGGEDQDLFLRAIERGEVFVWCDEAPVFEEIPSTRWDRRFLLSRALLRGKNSFRHRRRRLTNIARSIVAVPAYFLLLPVVFVLRREYVMKYLVKLADHIGRLLAALGFNLVSERPM